MECLNFKLGLSQHVTLPELTFCGEVQLIVAEQQSYCIIQNDVMKLDISLIFLDKISVKTNLKLKCHIVIMHIICSLEEDNHLFKEVKQPPQSTFWKVTSIRLNHSQASDDSSSNYVIIHILWLVVS